MRYDDGKTQEVKTAIQGLSSAKFYVCCDHFVDNHPKRLPSDGIAWLKDDLDGPAHVAPPQRGENALQVLKRENAPGPRHAAHPSSSPVAKRTRGKNHVKSQNKTTPIKERYPYSRVKDKASRLDELRTEAVRIAGSEDEAKWMLQDLMRELDENADPRLALVKIMVTEMCKVAPQVSQLEIAMVCWNTLQQQGITISQKSASDLCGVSRATMSRAVGFSALLQVRDFPIFPSFRRLILTLIHVFSERC